MISVRLSDDGRRVVLGTTDIAEVVVGVLAVEYAEAPRAVGADLEEIAARRSTFEGLAGLKEICELPERVLTGAAAALDAAREDFVSALSEPAEFALSERDARQLAVELMRHASLAAVARLRDGGVQ
ncbi:MULTISPECIES: hypothetical protein [unclassified Streptomyces]|uniref:hypothetical protein n=1 Tax=unclassified Streptomyces TaxID=2593676 RepID=UPI0003640EF3|nr:MULTISPECIES: hypothetical protein [unclassified Streptomyces]MYT30489.1 hypothetical protein [Streptomyces sp. SID8354]